MSYARSALVLLVLIYLAAVTDSALCPRLAIGQAAPDAFVLLAVLWLTLLPGEYSYRAAAMIGLAADLCGPGRLGIGMACYLVTSLVLYQTQKRLAWQHSALRFGLAVPAAMLLVLLLGIGQWMTSRSTVALSTLCLNSLRIGCYTAVVSLIALMILTLLWRRTMSLEAV